MIDGNIAVAVDLDDGRIAIAAGCGDGGAVNRDSIGLGSRGDKAAKLLSTGDVMSGLGLHIQRIAHTNGVQRNIARSTDHNMTIGVDVSAQIKLSVEDLSRIVRVARCAQQGRGARARGQRFGESGHWRLLFGKRKSCGD